MPFTLYDSTIPTIKSLLTTLSHILHKAERTHPDPTSLLSARLHDDMYPLTDQIRIAAQWSENLLARLTARDPVTYDPATLTSFAGFYERIDTVLASFEGVDREVVDTQADVMKTTPMGPGRTADMSGAAYVHVLVMPNVHFHVVTAYGILRKEGVDVGKADYFRGFVPREVEDMERGKVEGKE